MFKDFFNSFMGRPLVLFATPPSLPDSFGVGPTFNWATEDDTSSGPVESSVKSPRPANPTIFDPLFNWSAVRSPTPSFSSMRSSTPHNFSPATSGFTESKYFTPPSTLPSSVASSAAPSPSPLRTALLRNQARFLKSHEGAQVAAQVATDPNPQWTPPPCYPKSDAYPSETGVPAKRKLPTSPESPKPILRRPRLYSPPRPIQMPRPVPAYLGSDTYPASAGGTGLPLSDPVRSNNPACSHQEQNSLTLSLEPLEPLPYRVGHEVHSPVPTKRKFAASPDSASLQVLQRRRLYSPLSLIQPPEVRSHGCIPDDGVMVETSGSMLPDRDSVGHLSPSSAGSVEGSTPPLRDVDMIQDAEQLGGNVSTVNATIERLKPASRPELHPQPLGSSVPSADSSVWGAHFDALNTTCIPGTTKRKAASPPPEPAPEPRRQRPNTSTPTSGVRYQNTQPLVPRSMSSERSDPSFQTPQDAMSRFLSPVAHLPSEIQSVEEYQSADSSFAEPDPGCAQFNSYEPVISSITSPPGTRVGPSQHELRSSETRADDCVHISTVHDSSALKRKEPPTDPDVQPKRQQLSRAEGRVHDPSALKRKEPPTDAGTQPKRQQLLPRSQAQATSAKTPVSHKGKEREDQSAEYIVLDAEPESDDEGYGVELTNMGYQSGSTTQTSGTPGGPRARRKPIPIPKPRKFVPFGTPWSGGPGGALRFIARPPGYENVEMPYRWSFSQEGPVSCAVDDRLEGDIHFSPATADEHMFSDEPFVSWVSVCDSTGLRWRQWEGGQPHPRFKGFVLKPAQLPRTPPRWVKESSYKSSLAM